MNWTIKEDNLIKRKYPKYGSKILGLNRTVGAIRRRAEILNIKNRPTPAKWSEEQILILKENYSRLGPSSIELLNLIGKSRASIMGKVKEFGLKCSQDTKFRARSNAAGLGENNVHFTGYKCISGSLIASIRYGAKVRNIQHPLLEKNNVDYEYLYSIIPKDLKCPLSGLQIEFREKSKSGPLGTASLDRIDSSKGYIKGNVQWVHKEINQMKSDRSDEEFIVLCNRVAKLNPKNI